MHIAYSAINDNLGQAPTLRVGNRTSKKVRLRYRGYQAACQKYEQEIAAIQQYLPGWQPRFK